ncbi:MAG: hypothetical protein V7679_13185 [Parasphingorhabdus sp.]
MNNLSEVLQPEVTTFSSIERFGLIASILTMISTAVLVIAGWTGWLAIQIGTDGALKIYVYHLAILFVFLAVITVSGMLLYITVKNNRDLHRSVGDYRLLLEQSNQMIAPQSRLFNSLTQIFDRVDQISDRFVRKVDNFSSGIEYTHDKYKENLLYVVDQTRGIFERLTGTNCAVCIKYCANLEDENADLNTIGTVVRDSISYGKRKFVDGDGFYKRYSLYSNTAFEAIVSDHTDDIAFICNDLKKFDEENGYQNCNKHWRKYYNACLVVPIKIPSETINNGLYGFLCIDNMHGGFDRQSCLPIARAIASLIFADMLYYYMENVPEDFDEEEGSDDANGKPPNAEDVENEQSQAQKSEDDSSKEAP